VRKVYIKRRHIEPLWGSVHGKRGKRDGAGGIRGKVLVKLDGGQGVYGGQDVVVRRGNNNRMITVSNAVDTARIKEGFDEVARIVAIPREENVAAIERVRRVKDNHSPSVDNPLGIGSCELTFNYYGDGRDLLHGIQGHFNANELGVEREVTRMTGGWRQKVIRHSLEMWKEHGGTELGVILPRGELPEEVWKRSMKTYSREVILEAERMGLKVRRGKKDPIGLNLEPSPEGLDPIVITRE
jgi:hypothetical protein